MPPARNDELEKLHHEYAAQCPDLFLLACVAEMGRGMIKQLAEQCNNPLLRQLDEFECCMTARATELGIERIELQAARASVLRAGRVLRVLDDLPD